MLKPKYCGRTVQRLVVLLASPGHQASLILNMPNKNVPLIYEDGFELFDLSDCWEIWKMQIYFYGYLLAWANTDIRSLNGLQLGRCCNVGALKVQEPSRFRGPTWGPSGADRTQVGSMLAPWTLLSGSVKLAGYWSLDNRISKVVKYNGILFYLCCHDGRLPGIYNYQRLICD